MKSEILHFLPRNHPWAENIIWYDTIDSTNTQAKKLALSGAPHGTVLLAGQQTGGRGRMGRSFLSPPESGIYLSVILRPDCAPTELMHLTCATAVAMCNAVQHVAGFRPKIKWTNDLVFQKRKLGGILTELVFAPEGICAIVGIGLNCNQTPDNFPEDLRQIASSLSTVVQKPISLPLVAAHMIQELYRLDRILMEEKQNIMQAYQQDCITIGQDISILQADTVRHATAIGIDDNGGLIVRYPSGDLETIQSGEVSVRGMYGYL